MDRYATRVTCVVERERWIREPNHAGDPGFDALTRRGGQSKLLLWCVTHWPEWPN